MRFLLFLLIAAAGLPADNVHDWQTITSKNYVRDMATFEDKLWVASTGGLYSRDLNNGEVKEFTNVDGLQAVEVAGVTFDSRGQLIVGGETGFIQTVDPASGMFTDVYLFEDVSIIDVTVNGDTLWVATDEGASQFLWNGSRYLFKGFFRNFRIIPNRFTVIAYFAGRVWLGTDRGLLSARGSSNTLEDPTQWKLYDIASGLPGNVINNLSVIEGRLWIATNQGLTFIDSDFTVETDNLYGSRSADFTVRTAGGIKVLDVYYDQDIRQWFTDIYNYLPGSAAELEETLSYQTMSLALDRTDNLWFGFDGEGILRRDWPSPERIDGPGQTAIRYIVRDSKGRTWASSGKFKSTPNLGYSLYDGLSWTHIDFRGSGWGNLGNTDVLYEDRFGNVWLGSWGGGVMVYGEDEIDFLHSYTTSGNMLVTEPDSTYSIPLQPVEDAYRSHFSSVSIVENYEIITDIREDFSGRLWFGIYWPSNGNILASAPLDENGDIVLDKSRWVYFGPETNIQILEESNAISCFEFDDFGRIWIGTLSGGLYILDYNNTLTQKSDDRVLHLTTSDRLYSNEIRSIAKDEDGIIWIGTTGGLNSSDGVVVNNSINIFRHIGDIEGNAGPLGDRISHIFTDDFNNKWISTSSGLSILRSDRSPWDSTGWIGFTRENSGLVDNQVHGVFVDHATSQAYIATEKGISVYEGSFAQIRNDYAEVVAGPNPFIIGEGSSRFTINRLKENSAVRILSLNGTLIRELTNANGLLAGSQAVWDGKDLDGEPVASGIYLFLAYTEDGTSTAGKIAVIRK